jgi:hypothetical protein
MPVDETWDGKPHWQKEPEVPEKYIQSLDKAVEAGQCSLYINKHYS